MRASLVRLNNISTFQGTRLVAGFALGHALTHGCAWTPGMGEGHIHDYLVVLRIYSDLHANAVLFRILSMFESPKAVPRRSRRCPRR